MIYQPLSNFISLLDWAGFGVLVYVSGLAFALISLALGLTGDEMMRVFALHTVGCGHVCRLGRMETGLTCPGSRPWNKHRYDWWRRRGVARLPRWGLVAAGAGDGGRRRKKRQGSINYRRKLTFS